MKQAICLMGMLLLLLTASAQRPEPPNLTGKVTSTSGEALQGVTLQLKQSGRLTVTNDKGQFSLSFSQPDTLIVQHVGYQETRLFVNSSSTLSISLASASSDLEEVTVNTGYQTIPKERATGSFEQIDNKMLNLQYSTDILSRLKGTSSILFEGESSTGRPAYTIRGISSIYGPKSPLIVVDNFPYEGNINNINPNDVESVSMLKDAAAASIWGTRAGNGVIVITTKKGKLNQPLRINIGSNLSVRSKPDIYYLQSPYINSSDFIDVEQMLFANGYFNSKINSSSKPGLSPVVEILLKERNGQITTEQASALITPYRSLDVRNDFDKYVYGASVKQQYNIGLNGGSDKMSYDFSAGWDKNKDELAAIYDRLTLKAGGLYRITKSLEFRTSFLFTQSFSKSGKTGYTDLFSGQYFYPYAQLADANGQTLAINYARRKSYTDTAGGGYLMDWNYYPLDDYKHNVTRTSIQDLVANFSLRYTIASFAHIDVQYQHESQTTNAKTLYDVESYFARDLINQFSVINRSTGVVTYKIPKGSILAPSFASLNANNIRGQLNIGKSWGRHQVSGIAGGEIREIKADSYKYRVYGYNDDILTFGNVDYANSYTNYLTGSQSYIPNGISLGRTDNRYVSLFANGAYTFEDRYTLSGSVRRDASNLFGVSTNDKWSPFWSVGGSWLISNESFYQNKLFPYLRLRTTYGVSGNVDQSKSAQITMQYAPGGNALNNYPYGNVYQFGNPSLRWQKIYTLNIGLDFRSHNDVVNGSVEYYTKKGNDLFGASPVDYTSVPTTGIMINSANSRGKGIDLKINTQVFNSNAFKWDIGWIFSYSSDKVTKYLGADTIASNVVSSGISINPIVGNPVYSIVAYRFGGLDQTGDPLGYLNGVLSKDYVQIENQNYSSLKYIGSALPVYYGSITNRISYKRFVLSAGISYKLGYYFLRPTINYSNLFSLGIGHSDFAKRWQQPGDEMKTNIPSLKYPLATYRDDFFGKSEAVVTKGDHVRLQFVTLEYNIVPLNKNPSFIKNVRLFISGNNLLLIWKANHNNIDPDNITSLPAMRNITIGFSTNF